MRDLEPMEPESAFQKFLLKLTCGVNLLQRAARGHVSQIPEAILLRRPPDVIRELEVRFNERAHEVAPRASRAVSRQSSAAAAAAAAAASVPMLPFQGAVDILRALGFNPTDGQVRGCVFDMRMSIPYDLCCVRMTFAEFVIVWDAYISNEMVDLDAEIVKLAFEAFDRDGEGELDPAEVVEVLSTVGDHPLSAEEAHRFFDMVDENQSGSIDLEEFVLFIVEELLATEESRVRFSQEIVGGGERVAGGANAAALAQNLLLMAQQQKQVSLSRRMDVSAGKSPQQAAAPEARRREVAEAHTQARVEHVWGRITASGRTSSPGSTGHEPGAPPETGEREARPRNKSRFFTRPPTSHAADPDEADAGARGGLSARGSRSHREGLGAGGAAGAGARESAPGLRPSGEAPGRGSAAGSALRSSFERADQRADMEPGPLGGDAPGGNGRAGGKRLLRNLSQRLQAGKSLLSMRGRSKSNRVEPRAPGPDASGGGVQYLRTKSRFKDRDSGHVSVEREASRGERVSVAPADPGEDPLRLPSNNVVSWQGRDSWVRGSRGGGGTRPGDKDAKVMGLGAALQLRQMAREGTGGVEGALAKGDGRSLRALGKWVVGAGGGVRRSGSRGRSRSRSRSQAASQASRSRAGSAVLDLGAAESPEGRTPSRSRLGGPGETTARTKAASVVAQVWRKEARQAAAGAGPSGDRAVNFSPGPGSGQPSADAGPRQVSRVNHEAQTALLREREDSARLIPGAVAEGAAGGGDRPLSADTSPGEPPPPAPPPARPSSDNDAAGTGSGTSGVAAVMEADSGGGSGGDTHKRRTQPFAPLVAEAHAGGRGVSP